MRVNIISALIITISFSCNPPYLEDNIDYTSNNSVTAPASFYINVNPYCCERRGLDSADVINAALDRYGNIVSFTLVPSTNVANGQEISFTLNLLDNTRDLNGEHRYDNCDKLVSHTESLGVGEWQVNYNARNELGQLETRTGYITVQTANPIRNCFRIF